MQPVICEVQMNQEGLLYLTYEEGLLCFTCKGTLFPCISHVKSYLTPGFSLFLFSP